MLRNILLIAVALGMCALIGAVTTKPTDPCRHFLNSARVQIELSRHLDKTEPAKWSGANVPHMGNRIAAVDDIVDYLTCQAGAK